VNQASGAATRIYVEG